MKILLAGKDSRKKKAHASIPFRTEDFGRGRGTTFEDESLLYGMSGDGTRGRGMGWRN